MATSAPTNINKWLKGAAGKWKEAAAKAKDNVPKVFDDGTYTMQLVAGEIGLSQANNPQIIWKWAFLDGEYKGDLKFDYDPLIREDVDQEETLERVAQKFEQLGVDSGMLDFEHLDKELLDVVKMNIVADVKLRTSKTSDYQGVRIQRILEDYDGELHEPKKAPATSAKAATGKAATPAAGKAATPAAGKPAGKATPKKPESEPEPEVEEEEVEVEVEVEVEEETVEIYVNQPVKFTWKGEELEGKIKEIFEEEQKAKISCNGKIYPVKFDDITPLG